MCKSYTTRTNFSLILSNYHTQNTKIILSSIHRIVAMVEPKQSYRCLHSASVDLVHQSGLILCALYLSSMVIRILSKTYFVNTFFTDNHCHLKNVLYNVANMKKGNYLIFVFCTRIAQWMNENQKLNFLIHHTPKTQYLLRINPI